MDRLAELRTVLNSDKNSLPPPEGLFKAVIGGLTRKLGSRELRMSFLQWAFDPFIVSSSELSDWQKQALVQWGRPGKLLNGTPWTFSKEFRDDCLILKIWLGQKERRNAISTSTTRIGI